MVNTPVGILASYCGGASMTTTIPGAPGSGTADEPSLTPAARRILDAATDLFYSRGINSVGVELVAEQAGTTKKTIYDRFGSKEGLVVAYLEARARRWQAHVTDHVEQVDGPASDRVVAVID